LNRDLLRAAETCLPHRYAPVWLCVL